MPTGGAIEQPRPFVRRDGDEEENLDPSVTISFFPISTTENKHPQRQFRVERIGEMKILAIVLALHPENWPTRYVRIP